MKITINRRSEEWQRYAAAALTGILANHVSEDEDEDDDPVSAAATAADEMFVEVAARGDTEIFDLPDAPPPSDAS